MGTVEINQVVIGWLITVALTVAGYVFAFIKQNGKNEARQEETRKEIERLAKADGEMMEKIDKTMSRIDDAMQWGRGIAEERYDYNEKTYVKKEVCEISHRQIVEQLNKISSANIDVRLAKIETSQQQILVAIEELKRQKNTIYNNDR